MVLDKFRGQPLIWDKANKLFHEKIVANGSDANGRKLVVQVVNDGVVENLTGSSLSLSWKKGSNDGLDGFKVVDASKGLFELYYPTGLLSNVGRMDQANLYLVDSTGATTSRSFEFVVEQGINKEAAESSSSFTAFDQALMLVGNIDNKADKSDLQALNLAYKESFATLAALKAAYPAGDKFNHVVLADMLIYTFKTDWISTGIQANGTGIANNSLTTEKYADKSVVATKTDFLQLKGEKETRVNLMPATLGPLGDYYDHTNGRVSNSPGTQTFKPTGKIQFLGKPTFISYGVSTWAFFNAANGFVGGKELLPADIPKETTITFPSTASYGVGNVKDWFFPIGDPNRSPYPQGVATATILNTSYEYGMKELIVDSENLSDSVKELIESKSSGVLQGLIYVNFGDSLIESKDPSVSELFAQQSGAITINVGFGGCMMCPHPNLDFAKFSMSNLVDAIASGDFSQQEAALSKPGIPASFRATLERLKAIDWATVAGITIHYGTNDWLNSNKIDNSANPYDKAYYLGALRYSVRKMMQAFKHLQVVVSPPIFRSTNDRTENANNWKNANNEYLKDYANAVARAGNELKILVADTFYGLGINEFNEGQYFPANDGTHPNAKGKALLAGKLVETVGYGASATPDTGAVEKRVTDLVSEKANRKQEEWITPTLLNGWTEASTTTMSVRYFKDSLGFVHVKGRIQGGNGSAFVLPVGYRPGSLLTFLTWGANRIEIYQGGTISPITATSQVSIDGIAFKAEG